MKNVTYVIGKELIEAFENVLKIEHISIATTTGMELSMTEIHTIAAIGMEELQKMSEIAGQLHITVGTLTVAINNLVKKGFVERYKSEKDRRIVKVGLTKRGKMIYNAHEAFHCDLVNALIKDLDEGERKVVMKALVNLGEFITECYGNSEGKK